MALTALVVLLGLFTLLPFSVHDDVDGHEVSVECGNAWQAPNWSSRADGAIERRDLPGFGGSEQEGYEVVFTGHDCRARGQWTTRAFLATSAIWLIAVLFIIGVGVSSGRRRAPAQPDESSEDEPAKPATPPDHRGKRALVIGSALLVLVLASTFVPLRGSADVDGTKMSIACGNAWSAWEMGGSPTALEITSGFDALRDKSQSTAYGHIFDAAHACERWARVRIVGFAALSLAGLVWAVIVLGGRMARPQAPNEDGP
jgi:hypothetical protein